MTVGATVDEKTIGNAAGKGLRWSLPSTVGARPLTFAVGIVLARLLTPADFGAFAIASAALLFVMHITNVGLIAAGVLTAVVTVVVARITGPYQIVELAVAGVAGLLCYIPIAMPADQLRRLAMSRGGGGQAPA